MTYKNKSLGSSQKELNTDNSLNKDSVQFRNKYQHLLNVDDNVYNFYFTYEDPISRKITDEDRNEIIVESKKAGKVIANELLVKYNHVSPMNIIKKENIHLIIKEEKENDRFVYFGAYDTDGSIQLYRGNLSKSKHIIKNMKLKTIEYNQIEDIILSHELFHYFEDKYPDLYTNTKEIELWHLGPFTHKSNLICPSEIAAMSFTKTLLNLTYNPASINYLLYSSIDTKVGEQFYSKIMKLNKSELEETIS